MYGVAALASGVWFLLEVARSMRADDPVVDYRVFKVSIAYLFVLFGAMLADCALKLLPLGFQAPWVSLPPVL